MATMMVSQHRSHQCHGRSVQHALGSRFCYSPPPRGLKGVNCRAFHSGIGILPSPRSDPPRRSRSSPIPIGSSPLAVLEESASPFDDDDIELWAGPAYSNSPPPSSLPIPKFSLCHRRRPVVPAAKSAPASPARVGIAAMPTTTPCTPSTPSSPDEFSFDAVFATWDLCRMLNLDTACE